MKRLYGFRNITGDKQVTVLNKKIFETILCV